MKQFPDLSDNRTLEKYSSAFSLSDMEIFVFPELLFPLVIANIMSPILWEWRNDKWFKDIHKKTHTYKVNRIKQYIMDNYVFNLDLDTWGLTQKDKEIDRFKAFLDMDTLRQSNALFGYEGDKYYFDIDIRKHFGLDKYTSDIIPYWKTETVEAMNAFKYKDSFNNGAGECVSFSALYAAALFVVGRIPLENIFLIGTPLHSQNFIDVNEGMLTNNRRIVTKNMWFNGTAMSSKARRALENEKVTIVSHISGYIHHVYPAATINKDAFKHFSSSLAAFVTSPLSPSIFINFLRYHMSFKKCFQYRHFMNNRNYYIGMDKVFEYEHHSKFNFSEASRESLIREIDEEEFQLTPLESRLVVQDVEVFLENNKDVKIKDVKAYIDNLAEASSCSSDHHVRQLIVDVDKFLRVQPQLPSMEKEFIASDDINLTIDQSRDEMIALITKKASSSETALLSLYVYRQMDKIDWTPFMKAALERNPVSIEGLKGMNEEDAYKTLSALSNESIYDGVRLAQPDEVWNYSRGDGAEKAILFANYLINKNQQHTLKISIRGEKVTLEHNKKAYTFLSTKGLQKEVTI